MKVFNIKQFARNKNAIQLTSDELFNYTQEEIECNEDCKKWRLMDMENGIVVEVGECKDPKNGSVCDYWITGGSLNAQYSLYHVHEMINSNGISTLKDMKDILFMEYCSLLLAKLEYKIGATLNQICCGINNTFEFGLDFLQNNYRYMSEYLDCDLVKNDGEEEENYFNIFKLSEGLTNKKFKNALNCN